MSSNRNRSNNYHKKEVEHKPVETEVTKESEDISVEDSNTTPTPSSEGKVIANLLYLRTAPYINDENIISIMKNGDVVTIDNNFIDDTWFFVEYRTTGVTYKGYAMKEFITVAEA